MIRLVTPAGVVLGSGLYPYGGAQVATDGTSYQVGDDGHSEVASDGTNFLVLWPYLWVGGESDYAERLVGARVSSSGALLDTTPLGPLASGRRCGYQPGSARPLGMRLHHQRTELVVARFCAAPGAGEAQAAGGAAIGLVRKLRGAAKPHSVFSPARLASTAGPNKLAG